LRALAVTGEKRWSDLPDVPTMQESGFPDLVSETFQGMYAPGRHAEGDRRARGARHARGAEGPGGREKLRGVGFDVRASGPAGLAARSPRKCRCGAS
jgi:hypothetical protein